MLDILFIKFLPTMFINSCTEIYRNGRNKRMPMRKYNTTLNSFDKYINKTIENILFKSI